MSSKMLIKTLILQASLTVTAIVVLSACGELVPAKKVNSKSINSISPGSPSGKKSGSFASSDDVVSAVEQAQHIVPFVFNSLEISKGKDSKFSDLQGVWSSLKVITESHKSCADTQSEICLSIPEIQDSFSKDELINRLVGELAAKTAVKAGAIASTEAKKLSESIFNKLPEDPSAFLFAEVEMNYNNSHPEVGVLRTALQNVLRSISKHEDGQSLCVGIKDAQDRAGRMSDDKKAVTSETIVKALGRVHETEKKSLLTRISALQKFCVDPQNQNLQELETELNASIQSLDTIYVGAKSSRDLLRIFRL